MLTEKEAEEKNDTYRSQSATKSVQSCFKQLVFTIFDDDIPGSMQ